MPTVKFTSALQTFFPELKEMQISGETVHQILLEVDSRVPGIKNYLLDDSGALRQHVNIFIKEDMITDRDELSDRVSEEDEIFIYQALSGG